MIMTTQPLSLLLMLLTLSLGAATTGRGDAVNRGKFLRGQRSFSNVFNVALRVHDTSTSASRPQQRRRARADNLLNEYVNGCKSYLTSQEVVADGIITQDEFVDFLIMQCRAEDICPKDTKLRFEQLDINLQLKFIMGICSHEDFADRSNCIYDLRDQWLANKLFGLRANDISDNTQSSIHDMCTEVYVDAVKMGFTRTTEPTSHPSIMPSAAPTLDPPRNMIPSSSPSNHPITPVIVTIAPTRMADRLSSAAPTTSDSGLEEPSTSPSSEFMPSVLPPPAIDVDANPPSSGTDDQDSLSRDTIIIAAALTFALLAVGSLCSLYNRPPRTVTTKKTFVNPTHDEWETALSSVPIACLGVRQSISSSPCSVRDHRFINVYSSEGSPIPQFNPSTANDVVIGTVSIGSSSFSSDFPPSGADLLANECESASSSLRSGRRTLLLNARKNARIRHHYKRQPHSGLPPSPRSDRSCQSIPMVLSCGKKLRARHPIDDDNIYLGDWRAVSYMSSEFYCGTSATSAAAAAAHNNFFFDLFTENNTLENASCHSLPVIPRQFSFASSDSDVGVSSVLSESFFKAESSYIQSQSIAISLQSPSTTPSNLLVPWRTQGFSQEMEFSDSNRSDMSSDSDSSVTFVALPLRSKKGFFGPSKRLLATFRKKTKAKFTFRSKQYQHLRGFELHEDPSVLSMSNTYLSEKKLTAQQQRQTPDNHLGTFAAAVLPFIPDSGMSLGAEGPTLTAVDLEANEVIQGEKSDSASAFSRSQFESSKGWSSCSRLSSISSSSSRSDSSSDGSQCQNDNLDCSFAEAVAPHTVGTETEREEKIDLSQICSESESSDHPDMMAWDVSESSEIPEEEDDQESFIGTIQDFSNGSLAMSATSLLPHLVSYSSEDMSFPSDEQSPLNGLSALNSPQFQRADNLPKDDDCSVEPASSDEGSTTDECAAYAIAWAIKNETKKLEGSIPL